MNLQRLQFFKISFFCLTVVIAQICLILYSPFISEGGSIDPSTLEGLKDENPSIRQEALGRLSRSQPVTKEVVSVLITALKDKSEAVREQAVYVAEKLGAQVKEATPLLLKMLTDINENFMVRRGIPAAVVKIDPSSAEVNAALTRVVENQSDELVIRTFSVQALGSIGSLSKEAVPTLTKVAKGESPKLLQFKAWEALAKIQPENREAVSQLLRVAQGTPRESIRLKVGVVSNSFDIVFDAMKTLVDIGEAKTVLPLLTRWLSDEHNEVKAVSLTLLSQIGSAAKPAIPEMLRLLQSKPLKEGDLSIKSQVISTMVKIGPASDQVIFTLKEIGRKGESRALRLRAWSAVAAMQKGNAEAILALTAFAEDEHEKGNGIVAALSLVELGEGDRLIPLLSKRLTDSDPTVKQLAGFAFSRLGSAARQAIPVLILALNDTDQIVRMRALETLGKIGPEAKGAIPKLKEMIASDPIPEIRQKASESLMQIQGS